MPVACKGEWLGADTFLLQVDLVGGINCYRFKLGFADSLLKVALSERTGLNEESFDGAQQH